MMYAKKHEVNEREIVAICDEDILGKTFEEGEICLSIKTDFYMGKKVNEKEALMLMKDGDILNLCGKECVGIAIKNNIIDKRHILKVKGVPHAQCF